MTALEAITGFESRILFRQRGLDSGMSRRKMRPGAILRMLRSGGSVNSNVVSRPAQIPCSADSGRKRNLGFDLEIALDDGREDVLHGASNEDAKNTSRNAEQQRLQNIDLDNLRGAASDALHDGNGIEPLPEVCMHGGGYADTAHDQRDEADQAQKAGAEVERARDVLVGLTIVGDGIAGEDLFQLVAKLSDG